MDFKAKMATGAVGGTSLVAATNVLAEMLDSYFKGHGLNYPINTVELIVATVLGFVAGGPFLVLSEIARQATLKGMAKLGIDLTKILGNGVALVLLCLTLGCASFGLGKASATERYYAAASDYLTAEEQATRYCETPTTPIEHCVELEHVIVQARETRDALTRAVTIGAAPASRFEQATGVLLSLLTDVQAILARRLQ